MPIVRKVETVGDVISAFAEVDVLHSHLSIEAAQSYGKQQKFNEGPETAEGCVEQESVYVWVRQ